MFDDDIKGAIYLIALYSTIRFMYDIIMEIAYLLN